MKKFLSTILAVVMVLSSMAMVVSADETLADGIYVGTTMYDSISAAQTAAVASNNEIIISGTVEFGYRQAITADSIHLRGINDAAIIPSASYASGSATNIKGLLNIQADNVRITDITFDGSIYGDTISQTTDFVVLRINEGTGIELDGVTVTGSPKTLISVGTSSTSASVTAENLYCQADYKKIPLVLDLFSTTVYSDIDVTNGTFTLKSGEVNGFIGEDGGSFENETDNHYTLVERILFTDKETTSTIKHYSESYIAAKNGGANYADEFTDAISDTKNIGVVEDMTEDAVAMVAADRATVEAFLVLLQDANNISSSDRLADCISDLNAALGNN